MMMNNVQEIEDREALLSDEEECKVQQSSSKRRYLTIEPAICLAMFYLSASSPVLQQYCYMVLGESENITLSGGNVSLCKEGIVKNDTSHKSEEKVQHEASLFFAQLSAVQLVPVLFSVITFGGISDKVGRKIGLILPMFGSCLAIGINAIIFWQKLSLNFLYLSKIVEGFFGGFALLLSAIFSYIADITTPEQRTFRIIVVEVVLIMSSTISNIGMGYLIKATGFLIPCLVLFGICVIYLVYVGFLPESFANAIPLSNCGSYCTIDNPKKSFMIYIIDTEQRRRWKLQLTAILMFILVMCEIGKIDVLTLFVLSSPLCFSPVLLGYFLCCTYMVSGTGSIIFTKLLQHRLHEISFLIIGCISAAAASLFLGFSTTTLMAFFSTSVGIFSRLTIGMIRAYCSKLMGPDEQGSMFASIAWLESSGYVAGTVTFDAIYAMTVTIYGGLIFFIIAGCYILGIIIASFLLIFGKRQSRQTEITTTVS